MVFSLKPVFMPIQTGIPCKWTSDSRHFILENFDTIQDSPSKLYNSTLTLCPSSSWLCEHYSTGVKVVVGSTEWDTCIRTVSCQSFPLCLAYWNNTIATGSMPQDIIIIDALTGSQSAVLSGHSGHVRALNFSPDGTFLVSGSNDKTIKLWDVQTGGVVKTLYGHTNIVHSVSISADNTMIASGSYDNTFCLWNVETEGCYIIEGHNRINTVTFSPTNSQLLLSSSDNGIIQQWAIDGCQIGSPIDGSYASFSSDGTQFVLCNRTIVTIQSTDSRVASVELKLTSNATYCCFSPDRKFIAAAAGRTIYLWDISSPEPCLIQTLIGHTGLVTSLVFPSSHTLISASRDKSVKFWQIVASSDQAAPDSESPPLASVPIVSVGLQAKDGLAFSVDSEGVVKTWDILTGLCKESIKTPAKGIRFGDIQVIDGRLFITWCEPGYEYQKIYFWGAGWDVRQMIGETRIPPRGLRISGDGSRIFFVNELSIGAWDIQKRELAIEQDLGELFEYHFDPLCLGDSKVVVCTREPLTQIWDFGVPGSTPIWLSEASSGRPHLRLVGIRRWSNTNPVQVKDSVTGKEILQLCGKYAKPSAIRWDGRYMVAGYELGEMLILDFSHILA